MSIVSRLAAARGRFLWRSFQRMTDHPEEVQRALLRRIMSANQDTAFGRQHRFAQVQTVADYQAAVPVGGYESFRPWVDRMAAGEASVLTAEAPDLFTLTSGTTGRPKLIPVNGLTRRSGARLTALWLYRCLVDHPTVLNGKALVVVSPAVEGRTPAGIPYGSASGYLYRHASWALRRVYALPYEVFTIDDYDAKYYAIMRFALETNVSLIATPNPGTILRLLSVADEQRERLIRDICDGSLSPHLDIARGLRHDLEARLRPNPKRARELEGIVQETGRLDPGRYWPRLAMVGCWKGGSVGVSLERLRAWFRPQMPFRDLGYLASEAFMALPDQDEGCAGIPALDSNFFEFIPEDEMGKDDARVLTLGQLEPGATYYIVITTPSGLYRYDINDVVRVAGFHRGVPLVEFVRKGRDMLSLAGEKLHVGQLIEAVGAAQAATGIDAVYFRAVGNVEACRYDLKMELDDAPPPDEAVLRLARAVDEQLAALNMEYAQKRRSGRLQPLCVHVMAAGWSRKRLAAKLAKAARDTQFKDALLGLPDDEDGAAEILRELSA